MDTNVAIHLRDRDEEIVLKVLSLPSVPWLSIFSLIELEGGIYKYAPLAKVRRERLDAILAETEVVGMDRTIVGAYGHIVRALGYSRSKVLDRLIAATAIVQDLTLITINGDDFRGIPGLKLEIWPTPPPQ